MEELTGKLRTYLTMTITVLGVFIALLTGLGYLGMTTYIQSIFKDKVEQETAKFDKLRGYIATEQLKIYTDQKIFVSLWQKYLKEQKSMLVLSSQSIDEINKSETFNSTEMAEFKKSLLQDIEHMNKLRLNVDEYNKLRDELQTNLNVKFIPTRKSYAISELFEIYPHVISLNNTLNGWIDTLTTNEAIDDRAKSILFEEYTTTFYKKYRETLSKFSIPYFSESG